MIIIAVVGLVLAFAITGLLGYTAVGVEEAGIAPGTAWEDAEIDLDHHRRFCIDPCLWSDYDSVAEEAEVRTDDL